MTELDRATRTRILRVSLGVAVYAGAFGFSFGAVSVGSGLSVAQTELLSLVMFSGASQFAFVGVAAGGGSPVAAVVAALLLAVRNAFYGVPVTRILAPRGRARLRTAHFVIDETTAMAVAQPTARLGRYAFWSTGLLLFTLWQVGTVLGALTGASIDLRAFGLDAAGPAAFLALLWPGLRNARARVIAVLGAAVALALLPVVPKGVPVIAAAAVAIVAGLLPVRAVAAPREEGP